MIALTVELVYNHILTNCIYCNDCTVRRTCIYNHILINCIYSNYCTTCRTCIQSYFNKFYLL